MLDIELLKRICNTPGVSGFEQKIRALILEEIQDCVDHIEVDALGNIIAEKKGKSNRKLLLTAHMDEIGFMVQHIDEEGFIRFIPLGGFDPKTLTAQRVIIHGKKDIIGVMGSKPIHIMSAEEKNKATQIKDYFIDTGLTKAEVLDIVSIGDPISRERDLIQLGKCINAKSLDNRISVYILIKLLKSLKDTELDLICAFTVQEEIGLRGAKIAGYRVAADYAINIDTTIAFDVPGAQLHEQVTKLGHGVAIKIYDTSAVPDYRMVRFLKECADGLKWQSEILTGGGTDTASIQLAGNGAITGAISIPTRNIHQVIEMVHEEDCEAAIQLLKNVVRQIPDFDWKF
ncbi:MAG: M42 family metallopeptidase [Saprospiraceae bacterium]|nr:M42 family metallopeptidase [Saprospiraceae bacterium]